MKEEEGLDRFQAWLINDQRYSPGTVRQTMSRIQYMFSHSSQPLSMDAFQAFIRKVWEKKGNKTANQYIKIANRWLKFKGIPMMKYFKEYGSEFTVQVCSPEEKSLLLETASRKGPREKAMFYLLFGTGVRLGEACDLRIQDVHPDTIKVRGKGQKVREIYLPPQASEALRSYLASYRTDPGAREDFPYVFTTKAGRKMSYNYFRKLCQDVAFAAGVRFHPHMARHTYATDLLKAGVSVVYVSQLLGHEDLESTSIYLHPSQYDAIRHAKAVDIFSRKPQDLDPMDWRGDGRPGSRGNEPESDDDSGGDSDDEPPGGSASLREKVFLFAMADALDQDPGRGNGAGLKGNTIGNKGNTTDKQPYFPLPNRFSSGISPIRATPKGATHVYRRSIQ